MARPGPRPGRDTFVVLGSMLLVGLLCGVLWWLLATPAEFTKTRQGGVMSDVQLGRRFSTDATYVVIAALAGTASGLALTWWRSRDPLVTSALLLLGSVLAAAVMGVTGYLLGPGDTATALAAAPVGASVPERLQVGTDVFGLDVWTAYLAWPVAVLVGCLVVLLGTTLDSPVQEPEFGEPPRRPGGAG